MTNIDADEFQKDHERLEYLYNRAQEMHKFVKAASGDKSRTVALRHLVVGINDFDEHVRRFIHKYPSYYEDNKEKLDKVMEANILFLSSVITSLSALSHEQLN